jgi:ubiquinone/menaquinone biosynthesis C-methylase UbiE
MADPPETAEPGPGDVARARRKYSEIAEDYDRRMRRGRRWQGLAVDRLFLGDGDVVIDVACGTGLNFGALRTAVGRRGEVIGIDASPEMLAIAQRRISERGWDNVELIEAPVEKARLDQDADAALFSFTHDVLQSPRAVANIAGSLKPGARVAAVGPKFARGLLASATVNVGVRMIARPFVTTFEGLDRPWRHLEGYVDEMLVEPLALGGAYVAWGRIPE